MPAPLGATSIAATYASGRNSFREKVQRSSSFGNAGNAPALLGEQRSTHIFLLYTLCFSKQSLVFQH